MNGPVVARVPRDIWLLLMTHCDALDDVKALRLTCRRLAACGWEHMKRHAWLCVVPDAKALASHDKGYMDALVSFKQWMDYTDPETMQWFIRERPDLCAHVTHLFLRRPVIAIGSQNDCVIPERVFPSTVLEELELDWLTEVNLGAMPRWLRFATTPRVVVNVVRDATAAAVLLDRRYLDVYGIRGARELHLKYDSSDMLVHDICQDVLLYFCIEDEEFNVTLIPQHPDKVKRLERRALKKSFRLKLRETRWERRLFLFFVCMWIVSRLVWPSF